MLKQVPMKLEVKPSETQVIYLNFERAGTYVLLSKLERTLGKISAWIGIGHASGKKKVSDAIYMVLKIVGCVFSFGGKT